jgi:transcriptional regulator with XRE-family HTH domain
VSELGDLLAEARDNRDETLRQVEDATGIPNAHLWQIENGDIRRPSPNILWTLATYYGLDFSKLLELAGLAAPAGQNKKRNLVAAFRAMDDLTTDEQNDVLRYMAELRKERDTRKGTKR